MTRVLAAIDCSAAARPVLSAASAVADLLGADVDALHVRERGWATAQAAADAAGVHLRLLSGRALERIIQEAGRPDVVAVVLGARATPGGPGRRATLRHTSPPPVANRSSSCHPIARFPSGSAGSSSLSRPSWRLPRRGFGRRRSSHRRRRDRHRPRDDRAGASAFIDQPQHEVEAWTKEFRRRYCDHPAVRLEVRMACPASGSLPSRGDAGRRVILAWSQRLAAERAALVRSVLEHSRIPVILVPVARTARRVPDPIRPSERALGSSTSVGRSDSDTAGRNSP